jgi:hypothetical protein
VNHTSSGDAAENGGGFSPYQAAELLEQATRQARRQFTPGLPLLWVFRAAVVLVAYGGFWLSVRDQYPYSGPTGLAIPVAFALVTVNLGWSIWAIKRAAAGVSGPAQRARRAWLGVMVAVMVAAYAVTAPLFHAWASHPVWGLYPANAPMLIVGLAGATAAAACRYWSMAGVTLAIALTAAAAGFGGPVGSWLIMGIGLSVVMLGTGAFIVWQQRRSVIQP